MLVEILNEMKEAIKIWLENADFKPKTTTTDGFIIFEKIEAG